jgi:hypothetical protein
MEEFRAGEHLPRWEPPDVAFLAYIGDLDGDSAYQLSQVSRPFTLPTPYVLLLIDMSRVGKITPEARKCLTAGSRNVLLRGIAVCGASNAMRILSMLITRAVDVIYGYTDNPTRFFSNEAEARAWLVERRKAVHAAGVGAKP